MLLQSRHPVREFSFSATWMRRSISQMASRYSLSFTLSLGPNAAEHSRRSSSETKSRMLGPLNLLHSLRPIGAVAVPEEPFKHRAGILLHGQRLSPCATKWCSCSRSYSRLRHRDSGDLETKLRVTRAACPSEILRAIWSMDSRRNEPSVFWGGRRSTAPRPQRA